MFWKRTKLMIKKEFLELVRDKALLPMILLMPVIQLTFFGYVVTSDVKDLTTVIVDMDHSMASGKVGDSLLNSGYFLLAGRSDGMSGARMMMDSNKAQVIVVVPKGFSEHIRKDDKAPVQVIVDGTQSTTGQIASAYAMNILSNLSSKMTGSSLGSDSGPGVDAQVRVWFNPTMRSVNTMVPGLIAFIMLMSVTMLMSQAVVKEREKGTLEQIFVTPITKSQYLLGKILPYIMVSFIQVTLVFTAGILWFKVPFQGSLLFAIAAAMLFLLTSLGQGLIVSTMAQTRQQAQMTAMFLTLPSMLLSGFVFPVDSMPASIRWITYLIPLRYFLVVVRSIFLKGSGPVALWPQLAAMAVFSTCIFGFALMRFQKKFVD